MIGEEMQSDFANNWTSRGCWPLQNCNFSTWLLFHILSSIADTYGGIQNYKYPHAIHTDKIESIQRQFVLFTLRKLGWHHYTLPAVNYLNWSLWSVVESTRPYSSYLTLSAGSSMLYDLLTFNSPTRTRDAASCSDQDPILESAWPLQWPNVWPLLLSPQNFLQTLTPIVYPYDRPNTFGPFWRPPSGRRHMYWVINIFRYRLNNLIRLLSYVYHNSIARLHVPLIAFSFLIGGQLEFLRCTPIKSIQNETNEN